MYKELKDVYYRIGFKFQMVVTYLFDVGFRNVMQITDEDIDELEENGIMTKEFVQDLVRTAREVANICEGQPINLVMFCMKEKLFDVKNLE